MQFVYVADSQHALIEGLRMSISALRAGHDGIEAERRFEMNLAPSKNEYCSRQKIIERYFGWDKVSLRSLLRRDSVEAGHPPYGVKAKRGERDASYSFRSALPATLLLKMVSKQGRR